MNYKKLIGIIVSLLLIVLGVFMTISVSVYRIFNSSYMQTQRALGSVESEYLLFVICIAIILVGIILLIRILFPRSFSNILKSKR
jgi:hypothetical protein